MDIGLIVLRVLHIVLGSFWVGTIFFTALFLMPAMAAAGPDAAKVGQALQQRRFMTIVPIMAVLTMLTGVDLLRRASTNFQSAWFGSGPGMGYSTGMLAAVAAFIVGFFIMRPLMLKAMTLPPAEGAPLRAKAMRMNQIVAVLLLVAVSAMAAARYL